jgi:SAM-dependent methyltransferase
MDRATSVVADLDARFDDDYLYFHDAAMTAEYNDRDAELAARFLDLTPGMEILDCPCAYGRIANRLAARGARVTGFDANLRFLERARQDAAGLGAQVEYVAGDMRQLPWTNRFDGVVNWYMSFGYFDDATNRKVLAEWRRALRPGGRLVIDHVNLPSFLRHLTGPTQPLTFIAVQIQNDMQVFNSRYNPQTGHDELERVTVRDGKICRHSYATRVFTFCELRDWLMQAGFSRVDGYAKDGSELTIDSGGMVVVAHA